MKRLAAAFFLLAGCTANAPQPTRVAIVESTATSAPVIVDAEAATIAEDCDAFQKRTKSEMATALGAYPSRYGSALHPATLIGFCATTPHGSWRIDMPTDWKTGSSLEDVAYALEAHFRIVHVGAHATATYVMEETLSNYGTRTTNKPVLFDFDGDGEPELYIEVREEGDEGHRAKQNGIFTFDGSAIVPYEPSHAFDIDTIKDVDGDGRPDLLIHAGYTDSLEACFSGFPYDHPPARFIAHSRADGSFTIADAAAKHYAAAWCPAAPASIASSEDAICARLWARTPREVLTEQARVSKSCITGYCDREVKGTPQPASSREDCGRTQQWFAHSPPFTFD